MAPFSHFFSSFMLVVNPLISKQDRTIREQSALSYIIVSVN